MKGLFFGLAVFIILELSVLTAQQGIPFKPVIIPLPSIEHSYSIVRTNIYPDDRFAKQKSNDYYVTKMLNGRLSVVGVAQKQSEDIVQN
jgi:hypothetical protein